MKFKVGDVIRRIKDFDGLPESNYIVHSINKHGTIDIGNGLGYSYIPNNFELVTESTPTQADLKRGYWTVNNLQKQLDKLVDDSISTGVKYDSGKPDMTMIPFQALEEVAKVMMFGKEKYGRDNWKAGITTTRLSAAALRHLGQWCDGIDLDKESNENHIAHAAANLLMLLWTIKNKPEMDDR